MTNNKNNQNEIYNIMINGPNAQKPTYLNNMLLWYDAKMSTLQGEEKQHEVRALLFERKQFNAENARLLRKDNHYEI